MAIPEKTVGIPTVFGFFTVFFYAKGNAPLIVEQPILYTKATFSTSFYRDTFTLLSGSIIRVRMAATSHRRILLSGLKLPSLSFPFRIPAR